MASRRDGERRQDPAFILFVKFLYVHTCVINLRKYDIIYADKASLFMRRYIVGITIIMMININEETIWMQHNR